MAKNRGSRILKELTGEATGDQAGRLQKAAENLKRLQATIQPFTKPKPREAQSTAGKWLDAASMLTRSPSS